MLHNFVEVLMKCRETRENGQMVHSAAFDYA